MLLTRLDIPLHGALFNNGFDLSGLQLLFALSAGDLAVDSVLKLGVNVASVAASANVISVRVSRDFAKTGILVDGQVSHADDAVAFVQAASFGNGESVIFLLNADDGRTLAFLGRVLYDRFLDVGRRLIVSILDDDKGRAMTLLRRTRHDGFADAGKWLIVTTGEEPRQIGGQ